MRARLLELLACPSCAGQLELVDAEHERDEIVRGGLACRRCGDHFSIAGGIPRFPPASASEGVRSTAQNFGAQWRMFDEIGPHHEAQFRDWIAPVTPDLLRDRRVLELGCGKGRHTRVVGDWGAREIVAVDVSDAVDVAYRHTRHQPHVHVVQADINRLPLKRVFDYAFSIGVLHHLENPADGFRAMVDHVVPGGAVSCWVYGRENNGWIVHIVDPMRRMIFSRVSPGLLYGLAFVPAAALFVALRLIYRPTRSIRAGARFFYADYLRYIAGFPFREVHTIVYDHLTAPTAFYVRRAEFEGWFRDAGLSEVAIAWHNANSWRGFGVIGGH